MAIKKIIGSLLILLVLIILPLGSWYYLSSGLEYRKGLQKEIQVKSTFQNTELYKQLEILGLNIQVDSLIDGKANFIVFDKEGLLDQLLPIHEQFKRADKFQIICLSQEPRIHEIWTNLVYDGPRIDSEFIHLINHEHNYIGMYKLEDASLRKLIEHTAILIPRNSVRDIINKSKNKSEKGE